jgi:hypothetical protein
MIKADIKPKLADAIDALGITYSATFVPQKHSRNAAGLKKGEFSVNWFITLTKGVSHISTEYQQGIAHLKGYKFNQKGSNTVAYHGHLAAACNCQYSTDGIYGSLKAVAPTLADALESLVADADAIEEPDFESWAGAYGYDTDSREAEKCYQACLQTGLGLRAMIGNAALEALRELYADC